MIVLDKYTQAEDDTCYVYWYNKELGESAYADMKCNIGTDYVVYPECWDDVTLEDWVNASDGTVNIQ